MKNICIVTGFNNVYYDIANIAIPNFVEYCSNHNVDLHISTKNLNSNIHWGWNKYHIINDVIDKYNWIMWVDIDCLFINKKKNINDLIDENFSLILSENLQVPSWYKEDNSYIENGVFLLKNDTIGRELLQYLITDPIDHPWHDQYKMILALRHTQRFNDRTKKLRLIELNAIDDFNFDRNDMFIYHVAGGSSKTLSEKINLMNKYNEKNNII